MLKKIIPALLLIAILFAGCSEESASSSVKEQPRETTTTTPATTKHVFVPADTTDATFYSIETVGDYLLCLQKINNEFKYAYDQSLSAVNPLTYTDTYETEKIRMQTYYDEQYAYYLENYDEYLGDEDRMLFIQDLVDTRDYLIGVLQSMAQTNELSEDAANALIDLLF
ncbi:MAG: hypothetical protein LBL80_01690 [Ruminococcus sp.]|jgi:hypothetical protein|nr:hypothetical protein [Ruminococcus sp.]